MTVPTAGVAPVTTETPRTGVGAPRPGGDPLLDIRALVKDFAGRPQAVAGVDLRVWPGELLVVLGANGSGKSTLLRCAVRLIEPTSGSVLVAGRDLASLRGRELRDARRALAVVFQHGCLVGRRSALRNVACGALGRHRGMAPVLGRLPRSELERALDCLERVGMSAVAHRRADVLSGGQAQRVAIARALVQSPLALLADEPVASLDPEAAEGVMAVLGDLAHTEGMAVLCVLHQPELAMRHADRVVGMQDGSVVFDRPTGQVDAAMVAQLYRSERTVASA